MNCMRKLYVTLCCLAVIFLCFSINPLSIEANTEELPSNTIMERKELAAEKLLKKKNGTSEDDLIIRPIHPESSHPKKPKKPKYKEGEVLVIFKEGVETRAVDKILSDHKLDKVKKFPAISKIKKKKFMLVKKDGEKATELLEVLEEDPGVESVCLNYTRYINQAEEPCGGTIPNDPYFYYQWPLCNTGKDIMFNIFDTPDADIDATEAWDIQTGSEDVVVAVLDTGVNYYHPDLQNNMWVNQAEASGTPGIDDDGNGYIDDIHGIDTGDDDSNPLDFQGHGTHVAGTIAAEGNNAIGVSGVNWRAKIMAIKGFKSDGLLYVDDELEAIDYAITMKEAGVNIVAINASYGGYGYAQIEKDFIDAAGDAGIIFVAAAGNNATDNDVLPQYPASHTCSNILSVASTDMNDLMATYSNYGLTTVDLGAPGDLVVSTFSSYVYIPGEPSDIFYDDMESGGANWSAEATWAITTERPDSPGGPHVWSDSPDTTYQENTTSALMTNPIDLSAATGPLTLGFALQFQLEEQADWLDIYYKSPSNTWDYVGSITGSSGPYWYLYNPPISENYYWEGFQIKFELKTDADINLDGVYLDLVGIGPPVFRHDYVFSSGTSMATPHVSGAAALMAAEYPGIESNTIISHILSTVDPLPALAGMTVSGGRLNLYNMLTESPVCCMQIQLPPELQTAGATVNIEGQAGPYQHGDTLCLPPGTDIQWSLTVNGFTSGLKTKHVDCSDLVVCADDWCEMEIVIPDGCPENTACGDPTDCDALITVDIENLGGPYNNGTKVILPQSIDIQWSLTVNGLTSVLKTKHIDCTPLVVGEQDLCCMHIQLPEPLRNAGATVNITNLGSFPHCSCICLPKGVVIEWSLTVNGFTGGLHTKPVDCTDLVVTEQDWCEMEIVIPDGCPENTACGDPTDCDALITVDIKNLGGPYTNGTKVILPQSTDIQWSLTVNGFTSGLKTKHIDCTPLVVGDKDLCCMHIQLSEYLQNEGAIVNIMNLGSFPHCSCICLPQGISIQWSLTVNGFTTEWKTKSIDCTDLVVTEYDELCAMEIIIPNNITPKDPCAASDGCDVPILLTIRSVDGSSTTTITLPTCLSDQWSLSVSLPMGIDIEWSVSANGFTTEWVPKHVDCTPLEVEMCCMHISLPTELQQLDAKVNIDGLGSFPHCSCICLPMGIDIQWSFTVNGVTSGLRTKHVDCTDLVVVPKYYKTLTFKFGWTTDAKNFKTQIKDGVLVANGGSVLLPTGVALELMPVVYGHNLGDWITKNVDGTWHTLIWNLVEPTYE